MNTQTPRPLGSDYLQWARSSSEARFNLSSSGMPYLPLRELPVSLDDLELSGTGAYGYEPLNQAIAERYRVPAECVFPAFGTSMANHLVMIALLAPGDEVLIEHPTYEPLLALLRFVGAQVRRVERRRETGFDLDPAELERQVSSRTRLIVLTNLHNPSGALIEDAALLRVGESARRANARVLIDEVYLDALFEARPRTSFHLGESFVATSSLTKVYGLNGLRCGWVLAEPSLVQRLWRLNELYSNIGVHVAERLAVIAFQNLERIAARSRALLERNGAALNAFYVSRSDLDATPHRYGTVSFPRFRRGEAAGLCALLRERYETSVVPGHFFGMPAHFRIGLGVDSAIFAEGLARLGRALESLPEAAQAG